MSGATGYFEQQLELAKRAGFCEPVARFIETDRDGHHSFNYPAQYPHRDGAVIGENGHRYPSAHYPGTHWATDEAWKILDQLAPGRIEDDLRFLIAGMIAGSLIRIAHGRRPA